MYKNSLDPYIQTRLPYEWVARSMNKSRNMIELCDLISFRIQKLFVWNYGQKKEPWTVFLDSKFQDMTFIYCLDMNSEPRQVHLKNLTSNEVILFANIFSPYGPTSNTVHSPSVYSSPCTVPLINYWWLKLYPGKKRISDEITDVLQWFLVLRWFWEDTEGRIRFFTGFQSANQIEANLSKVG